MVAPAEQDARKLLLLVDDEAVNLRLLQHILQDDYRLLIAKDGARALELAALTAALNGADVDLREGSLYEPVAGERFDLIVSNPPFVMSPPRAEADTLAYREANFEADALVETLVRGAAS